MHLPHQVALSYISGPPAEAAGGGAAGNGFLITRTGSVCISSAADCVQPSILRLVSRKLRGAARPLRLLPTATLATTSKLLPFH